MKNNLYHYCAVWESDGRLFSSGGIMKSEDAVCFDNYNAFVKRIAEHIGQDSINLTSLSYLGQEQT